MPTLLRRSLPPALLLLAVCACSGPPADTPQAFARQTAAMPAYVDSVDARTVARTIVLCTTTADDLRHRLGEPTRDGVLHRAHILSWTTRSQSPERFLAVQIDSRGVVVDLYWDIPTEVPWVPADQCGSPLPGREATLPRR